MSCAGPSGEGRWLTSSLLYRVHGSTAHGQHVGRGVEECRLTARCMVLDDDFSSGLNTNTWTREVRLDGYNHGEFEWTTASDDNSFVSDGTLYLVPTLTSDVIALGP